MDEQTARKTISDMLPNERDWVSMVEEVSTLGIARMICDDGPRSGITHFATMLVSAGMAIGAVCDYSEQDVAEAIKTAGEILSEAIRQGRANREAILDGAAKAAMDFVRETGQDAGKVDGVLSAMRRKMH